MIKKDKVDDRYGNKEKNLPIFSTSQRLIKVDYLIFGPKKAFNL